MSDRAIGRLLALIREIESHWEEGAILQEMQVPVFDQIEQEWGWTTYIDSVDRDLRDIWPDLSVESRLLVCFYCLKLQDADDPPYEF